MNCHIFGRVKQTMTIVGTVVVVVVVVAAVVVLLEQISI